MFRAYDPDRDRLVAVKLFRLDLPPERVHQLVAEFEWFVAAGLTHPAIVAPVAAGISGVMAYLAQDYIVAESLDMSMRDHGLTDPAEALGVVMQLAGALDAAAAVEIHHGMLHPRDILLTAEDTRLTGLGIARALERVGISAPVRRPYTSPERIAGLPWDRRADVFALAVLTFELLWGRQVAGGDEAAASLTSLAGADDERLRATFGRALAEAPQHRFETALEFTRALAGAFPNVTIAARPAVNGQRRPPVAPQRAEEPRLPLEELIVQPEDVRSQPATVVPLLDSDRPAAVLLSQDELGGDPVVRVTPEREPVDLRDIDVAIRQVDGDTDRRVPVDVVATPPASPEHADSIAVPLLLRVPSEPGADPVTRNAALPLGKSRPGSDRLVSTISPLAFALFVGAAVGFAAGYGTGARDRSTAPTQTPASIASSTEPLPGMATAAQADAGEGRAVPTAGPVTLPRTLVVESTAGAASIFHAAEPVRLPSESMAGSSPTTARTVVPGGSLVVRSAPEGARVFVDGREYGRTPVTVRDLTRGVHRLRVASDGHATEERRVTVTAAPTAQTLTLRLVPARPPEAVAAAAPRQATASQATPSRPSMLGSAGRATAPLAIDSRPSRAKVFVDGRLVGETPLLLPELAAGDHALRLERDGYKPWSLSVHVVAGESSKVTASLDQ